MNGVKNICPSGTYGINDGQEYCLTCTEGFYCGEGTILPKECGDSSKFCPSGSILPQTVSPGYYSIGSSITTKRTGQVIAPRGHYARNGELFKCTGTFGSREGLDHPNCDGPCSAGFFCPAGSTEFKQYPCNKPNKFCPEGSKSPFDVDDGFYTTDIKDVNQTAIQEGEYEHQKVNGDNSNVKLVIGAKWALGIRAHEEVTGINLERQIPCVQGNVLKDIGVGKQAHLLHKITVVVQSFIVLKVVLIPKEFMMDIIQM
eukprot:CAMPEP_0184867422 /NCGR_PEP_ID=MMETSP0580-20130426/26458_1 /TAXON_ID=1118495 /ORGANISM="Dactyliosolen fragilissimus" /LENGTH=257 /DNA_ID=CAMNT_0027367701 /DNA_START=44 /DNA_END=818 /DNA_ORIENTATION=-